MLLALDAESGAGAHDIGAAAGRRRSSPSWLPQSLGRFRSCANSSSDRRHVALRGHAMKRHPRELATVIDYDDLHKAFRARADQLRLSRLSLDYLGSLGDGHASKILAPSKMRRMGLSALGPMCRALGIKLVVIDDPDQRERNSERVERRHENLVRHRASPQPSDSSAVA
jgi:hypothetical protein